MKPLPEPALSQAPAGSHRSGPRCLICRTPLPDDPGLRGPDRHHGLPGEFEVRVCAGCGAGVTLPEAEPGELAAYYPSRYGAYEATEGRLARHISRAIRRSQAFVAMRSAPLSAIRDMPPGRAVDVGCGRGDLGTALIRGGWQVTGIEPSREACRHAASVGIDARCGDVSDAELEPGAYDAAIFRHSLEHLADPVGDLRRIAEAVRQDGLVLVTVPNFGGWQAQRFRSRWYHLDLPRHRVHFTPGSLATAFQVAGLEVVRIGTGSSTVGLPASVQYAVAGRCVFPTGLPLRVATGLCVLAYPVIWPLDRLGGGDLLHAVARRP